MTDQDTAGGPQEAAVWQLDGPVVDTGAFDIVCYKQGGYRLHAEDEMREEIAMAQQVVADHRKAAQAEALEKALENISQLWVKYGTKVHLQDAIHIADHALAAYHAATASEETE